jgi:hypothetical protein
MSENSDGPSEFAPRLFRIGRKRYFVVGRDFIQRVRPYDDERISGLPADEIAWATSLSRAKALFLWHRNNGLHRSEPHPMGKDLAALKRAYDAYHADRYRQAGMTVPGCYLESGTHDGSSPQNQGAA